MKVAASTKPWVQEFGHAAAAYRCLLDLKEDLRSLDVGIALAKPIGESCCNLR
jgi:hypothetical protein